MDLFFKFRGLFWVLRPYSRHSGSFTATVDLVRLSLPDILCQLTDHSFQISLLNYEDGALDQTSMIPMVDGGTEGFKGNARVILPGISACVECTLDLYPPQVEYKMVKGKA